MKPTNPIQSIAPHRTQYLAQQTGTRTRARCRWSPTTPPPTRTTPATPPAAGPAPPPHLPSTIGPQQRPMSPSRSVHAAPQHPAPPPAPTQTLASTNSSNASLPAASFELPDVADLFDSPSLPPGGFPAMVGSSSRKRESNGSAIPPRSKFPRGQSAQTRGARNAATSTLVPPQLSGRSNVVTEDMGKLFVARRMD